MAGFATCEQCKRPIKAGGRIGRPYDPTPQPAGTQAEAMALAREHNADYEEV